MRRKDKEIKDKGVIEEILQQAAVCRVAMCDGDVPYVVPMSFGYEDGCLHLHSASEGKKIDILKQSPTVCFELDIGQELVRSENPCKTSLKYRSVIGYGRAVFVEDQEEKKRSLDAIVRHYSGQAYDYPEKSLNEVTIIRIHIESMTAKQSGG